MNMPTLAKLSDIIDGIEFQTDESNSYLNKKTGEVVRINDEEFGAAEDDEPIENYTEWQQENIRIAEEILKEEDYIPLPSKFDIHEYAIMEKFCLSIADDEIRDHLYKSIKGNGAFRRFKSNIRRCDIEDDWYKYRDEAIKQIAIDWCKDNGIKFIDEP